MSKLKSTLRRRVTPFAFHSLRNISSPEDIANDRKVYTGIAPISAILDLPTNENVRDYLVDAEGKQRKVYTSVHKAIRDTLIENPEDFSILNSGVVIVGRDINVDEKEKKVTLYEGSIINGSQTQGVIKDLKELGRLPIPEVHIKFEIIVTEDEDLIAETSIARNYQNDVMLISIAGRRNQFDELEISFRKKHPHLKLRKSESQHPNDEIVNTEKLLQVIGALVPNELWLKANEKEDPNKVYTYSKKARCLKEFQDIYKKAHDKTATDHEAYAALYKFYLDIVPQAWDIYNHWKAHQGFIGTGLSNGIVRDERTILEIADGIIFPIISSLSVFAKETEEGWAIAPPQLFDEKELIHTAKRAMIEIAKHNPQSMGKSKACYSALLQITSIYKKVLSQ
jgi:hypothetical protein